MFVIMRVGSFTVTILMIYTIVTTLPVKGQKYINSDAGGGNFSTQILPDSSFVADRFALYYWRNRIDLDANYLDNAWQMQRIERYLADSPRIDSITIYAYASPEGVYEHNVWLAKRRAEAARQYIMEHLPEESDFNAEHIRL